MRALLPATAGIGLQQPGTYAAFLLTPHPQHLGIAPLIFVETKVLGTFLIEPEPLADERGHFARTYCAQEFAERGLDLTIAQCSISFNSRAGTLRGMHYQADPYAETKLVRCTSGAIHDVVLDLRRECPTYLRWQAAELRQDNGHALFIPPGCAHGFQTLLDGSEVLYQISVPYKAAAARGVRWDDPAFAITWPDASPSGRTISARDASYPDYEL